MSWRKIWLDIHGKYILTCWPTYAYMYPCLLSFLHDLPHGIVSSSQHWRMSWWVMMDGSHFLLSLFSGYVFVVWCVKPCDVSFSCKSRWSKMRIFDAYLVIDEPPLGGAINSRLKAIVGTLPLEQTHFLTAPLIFRAFKSFLLHCFVSSHQYAYSLYEAKMINTLYSWSSMKRLSHAIFCWIS